MRALLLAAGRGERLRPLTDTIPKCLVEIGGKPLLQHWIERLLAAGFMDKDIGLNAGWLGGDVVRFVGERWPNITVWREAQLLGTGGTIKEHIDWLGRGQGESFFVAHADIYGLFDIWGLIAEHGKRPMGCFATMLCFFTDDPLSCGIIVRDEKSRVREWHEKDSLDHGYIANGGVYIIEAFRVQNGYPWLGDDLVGSLSKLTRRIYAVETGCFHQDIGTPKGLAKAQEHAKCMSS